MEKHVENKYRKAIIAVGGLCIKFFCPSFTGLPDRICLLPGARIWFVEFKFATGVLSARQRIVREMLQKLGFEVKVINEKNVDENISSL